MITGGKNLLLYLNEFIINTNKTTNQQYTSFSETTPNKTKTQWAQGDIGFIPMNFTLPFHAQTHHYSSLETDLLYWFACDLFVLRLCHTQAKQIRHYQFSETLQL